MIHATEYLKLSNEDEQCSNGDDAALRQMDARFAEMTTSHNKRRLDPENAAAEKLNKVEAAEVFCDLCNNGHNYKTSNGLIQHKKSAMHKKRLDPEVAAADKAAKKSKQQDYREKETARKAGEKETARTAARDQSKAHKACLQRLRTKALYEKQKAARVQS